LFLTNPNTDSVTDLLKIYKSPQAKENIIPTARKPEIQSQNSGLLKK
jgi:hypothetical protein